jgi:transposase InsO family protein
MADHMRTELVLDALGMAVAARGGDSAVAGVIAHADRGAQYTSNDYLQFCQRHQLRPSVGRTGVCLLTGQC